MEYERDGEGGSLTVGTESSQEEDAVPELDRTIPPEVGSPSRMEPPEIQELRLRNGLRVLLIPRHDVPLVALDLQIGGGGSLDEPALAGLAALTADLLDEGTANRTALDISDEIERLGATLTSFAGRDASRVRMSVLSARLPEALELLGEILREAAFSEEDLERVRLEQHTRILQGRDEPRVLADETLARALYGPTHPYGQPVLGTLTTLPALERTDVLAHYHDTYHAGNAQLVVAGNVTSHDLEPLLDAEFGDWAAGDEVRPDLPPASGPDETTIYLVDRPGSAQSEVRLARITTDRITEDYFALTVLNTVLGGAFTSRLNMNLREDKGFTYGARSAFALRRHEGPFVAGAAVHTPVTDRAVVEMLREIRRMSEEPVPEEELARARNYVALRLPQGFETVSDLATRVSELVLYGLDLDYYRGYVDGILAVSAGDVQDAARRYLSGGLAVVVVGDRTAVEEPLRALGVGPVVTVDLEEEAGSQDPL